MVKLKVVYIRENNIDIDLKNNKTYDVISIEKGWYRIIDESGEDYLYPPELFESIVENQKKAV